MPIDQLSALKLTLVRLEDAKKRYEELKMDSKAEDCRVQIVAIKTEIAKHEGKKK